MPYYSPGEPSRSTFFTFPAAVVMATSLLGWVLGATINTYVLSKSEDEDEVPER